MKSKSSTGFSLKDHLFNRERVDFLAGLFRASDPRFDAAGFVSKTMSRLNQLELKARITHIALVLEEHLDADFRIAAKQIVDALPPPLDPNCTDNDFGDFIFAPLGQFVVRNGLDAKYLGLSLKTLKAITMRFSMEDAIRAFINAHPERTLKELERWSTDANYHVRRLVSEGTRPLLPWSGRLSIDPTTPVRLLDTLHADPTRYVTRSVANHLNDLSKHDARLVLETLKRWQLADRQTQAELRWMTNHALRTLVKRGHAETLQFLGFAPSPKIQLTDFRLQPKRVQAGQAFEFSFTIKAQRSEELVVDYVIDFVKAGGKRSPKVHKLKRLRLERGESAIIRKKHMLRADATTFTLYPGTHNVTIQINGQPFGQQSFELLASA